ncbi:MAG: prepilin-type N-terminal cleavage/methylation domain-containing protein [Patescibacteria group bacterium]|nr:prepilin-type N-terminal cleavage/methylation domain-containing protein [Patescibacteria group bacterium]
MVQSLRLPARNFPRGFTLVEALVAISMTALAGSALLLGSHASLQSTEEATRQTIALGLAQQLMNEAAGASSITEVQSYNGYRSQPPVDRWGVPLGTENGKGGQRHANLHAATALLEHYLTEVHVRPVAAADLTAYLPAGTASDYCVVEVRVSHNPPGTAARELACLRRIVTHLPPYEPIE